MTLPVFWAPDLEAASGAEVELDGAEGRHAVVVRRIRVGERVVLTDGAGTRALTEVTATDKTGLRARVIEVSATERPRPELVVVQAIAKGDRAERAVEMLVEIGVDRIVPWAASRSVAVWRGDRAAKSLEKWRSTAREAAKQSRRTWFPVVAEQATTAEAAALVGEADLGLVLHEEAGESLASLAVRGTGRLVLVVGPEGGIAPEELDAFAAAGAHLVRMGETVLRTSTAGVAAVAAVLSRTERWS